MSTISMAVRTAMDRFMIVPLPRGEPSYPHRDGRREMCRTHMGHPVTVFLRGAAFALRCAVGRRSGSREPDRDRWVRRTSSSSGCFGEEFPAVLRTVFLVCHDTARLRHHTGGVRAAASPLEERVRIERPGAWVRRVAIRLDDAVAPKGSAPLGARREVDAPVVQTPADVDLLHAIADLPPKQRAATVLFYFEDMPLADVAQILGCSHATARVHVQRARMRLATVLGEVLSDDVG